MIFPFGKAYFQGRTVSFRECILVLLIGRRDCIVGNIYLVYKGYILWIAIGWLYALATFYKSLKNHMIIYQKNQVSYSLRIAQAEFWSVYCGFQTKKHRGSTRRDLTLERWTLGYFFCEREESNDSSGQIIIFHQPRFPWNKGISLTIHHHLGKIGRVRSL